MRTYVFPTGMVDVELITKNAFNKAIEEGRLKGHTHCQIVRVGYCDRFEALDSVALEKISNNIEGYGVVAVKTGFPVYSNCNRFRYDPYISGVTERPNRSLEASFARFINN